MQGDGILIPTYRNEHDRRGLREPGAGDTRVPAHNRRPSAPPGNARGTRPVVTAVKYAGCYPKASELCLRRGKPGETPVDARSGSDVQIDRLT